MSCYPCNLNRYGNTAAIELEDRKICQLHSTIIVDVDLNARHAKLYTGGYDTPTTKKRMNEALNQFGLPGVVYQKDYTWYWESYNGTVKWEGDILVFNIDTCQVLYNGDEHSLNRGAL